MDRFLRFAIPTMFAGIALGLLYVVFGASSKGSHRDPVAKLAIGALAKLDLSDRGVAAPTSPFVDIEGQSVTLQDFEGQAVLINFWATWCPPCIHELPSLMRLDQRLRQQNMAVMLISVDRAGIDKARPFLEKLGIAGTELGFDPRGDLAKAVGIKALPTSFCINADGIMTAQIVGDVEWDQPAVIETILPYLSA